MQTCRVVRRLLLTLIAVSTVALPREAGAWNAVGHMATAKLAYDRLTPTEQTRLLDVLREHPHFADYLAKSRPEQLTEGEWAAMRAAVWPDWIRPPKRLQDDPMTHRVYRFHRGPWHYVNFPYRAGQASAELPIEPLRNETNILEQLGASIRQSRSIAPADSDAEPMLTPAQNRAVRVCWMFHLLGDLHQPLHTVSLVDERRLPGETHDDQGGNLSAVRVEIGAYPIRLHSLWDQLLGTDNHAETILRIVAELQADTALRPTEAELTGNDAAAIRRWAGESYRAAKQSAYLNGQLPTAVWDDTQPTLPAVDDVPILPEGYERDARLVARRRIVLAGERLARVLKDVLQ